VDDAGLIALARRGDAVAFSRLFGGFERPIFRYAAHMCGRDAADDVVQDTFLAVLRPSTSLRASGSGGYDPSKGTVGSYLFGIARHFVLKRLKACERATFELKEDDLPAGLPAAALANAGGLAEAWRGRRRPASSTGSHATRRSKQCGRRSRRFRRRIGKWLCCASCMR
jgi:DNA-directed RNA polymerase specialized sigma24 family protein